MTAIGISGNILVLFFFHISIEDHKIRPTEKIISNLAVANLVWILTLGVPHSCFVFGLQYLYSDVSCKINTYVAKVSRAMAIDLTCFLSCLQYTTIMSSTPKWDKVKKKLQAYLIFIIPVLLLSNMTCCVALVLFTFSAANVTNMDYTFNLGYCLVIFPDKTSFLAHCLFLFSEDLTFVVLMILSSICILLILYKHNKRVKRVRNTDQNQEKTAERQAAKMVVTLVSLYVFFFGIENTIFLYQVTSSVKVHSTVSDIRYFFSTCFTSIFPIVIIVLNSKIKSRLRYFVCEKPTSLQEIFQARPSLTR
ncbi:olfactory receptor class A-like protein 1 [Protopterus annectens]|uniref:olfactory receptor class A-like protein 1 n=1 Tax=Protopterus annectens TaxID=7888 RepID=UPI001CFA900F|nr:olfactory receptor class A-like protein 1 [Protopterus annectens]